MTHTHAAARLVCHHRLLGNSVPAYFSVISINKYVGKLTPAQVSKVIVN